MSRLSAQPTASNQILPLLMNAVLANKEAISSISRFLQFFQLAENNANFNNEDNLASTNDTDDSFCELNAFHEHYSRNATGKNLDFRFGQR